MYNVYGNLNTSQRVRYYFIRITTIESKSNHLPHGYFYIEYTSRLYFIK